MNIKNELLVCLQFFRRDIAVYKQRLKDFAINFVIIYPLLYTLCFGYILAKTGGGVETLPIPVLSTGLAIFTLFPLAFGIALDLLFDFEHQRFIDFQVIVLRPSLVLLEKIFFTSLLVFACNITFYPIVIGLLHSYFDMGVISWFKVALLLYVASLFCSAFGYLLVCVMKDMSKIRFVWRRCNYPLIMLGGFLAPWKVMVLLSPLLGYAVLLNPMLYITEGLRQAILAQNEFLSYWVSFWALLIFSGLSIVGAVYFFKKKLDHI